MTLSDFLILTPRKLLQLLRILSHFCSLEAGSSLWRVQVAGWKVSMSEMILVFLKKITGSEFAIFITNTLLDVKNIYFF